MFINDVYRKEEIRNIAVQHLRKYGVKYRPKKPRACAQQMQKYGRKFFKVPLLSLETETVTLTHGQQLVIPKRIHEMCLFILSKVKTEGIFRKEGSKSRQQEIKLTLDRGFPLGNEHHVIDVAVVLKCFLRELPEPLVPSAYNDLFLLCSLEKRPRENVLECLLLACLLLPSDNLNVLSYLMQFFHEVASFAPYNKMSISNLSILIGPNIFPMDDKLAPKSSFTIARICDITKLLIENSRSIGIIPDNIIEQIGQLSDVENEKKRKNKRRSGSLTRMLNGLKKIVSSKSEEDSYVVTPDLLITPTIHASVKKRKGEGGLSLKKKKEVLTKLPDCAVLNAPFTPSRTPVSVHPKGKKSIEEVEVTDSSKEKKMHWYMRSRSMKSLKDEDCTASNSSGNTRRNSTGPKSLLERRWSAVSNAANFRKKKRNSCSTTIKKELRKPDEPDYVRVSKTEYEEFKNRVSAIERRISLELDNVHTHMDSDNDNNANREIQDGDCDSNIENVQTAYEKTLETGSLSPTTDQLARRLSRNLKIRRSAEQKIIRSPSARKIGTIRRRSTEREKKHAQVVRNQSWHVRGATQEAPLLPRLSVRRKRGPNEEKIINTTKQILQPIPPPTLISESSPQLDLAGSMYSTCNTSGNSGDHWVSAEGYFGVTNTPQDDTSANARDSIAKLRSQNIGMVRAKAKLFDNLKDYDTSNSSISLPDSVKKSNTTTTTSLKMSCRRHKKNSSISPRRRHANMSQKQRLQCIGRHYVRSNNNSSTDSTDLSTPRKDLNNMVPSPRCHMPQIKGPLTVKTPKRLCRTPAVDKKTPFRAIATPI